MKKVWTSKNGKWTIHKSSENKKYDWAIYYNNEEIFAQSRISISKKIPKEVDLAARRIINGENV